MNWTAEAAHVNFIIFSVTVGIFYSVVFCQFRKKRSALKHCSSYSANALELDSRKYFATCKQQYKMCVFGVSPSHSKTPRHVRQ